MKTLIHFAICPLIFIVISTGCKKQNTTPVYKGVQYDVSRMGNMRTWHGTDTLQYWTTDSVYSYNKVIAETFALTVNITDTTVTLNEILGAGQGHATGTYKYKSSDTINKTDVFVPVDYSPFSTITYYYAADSIIISGSYNGAAGTEKLYVKTP